MGVVEKLLAGTGILIAIYLVLTSPNTYQIAGVTGNDFVNGVRALQGR